MELNEYMEKIRNVETVKKELGWVFDELKNEKMNQKLWQIAKNVDKKEGEVLPKCDTLFDFVNMDEVEKLLNVSAEKYQELEVNFFKILNSNSR